MQTTESKAFKDEFKEQWKAMWRDRFDDKVRAEGIADKNYSLLFVERGTIIMATRKFRPLDFYEILRQHKLSVVNELIPLSPTVGGWGKFARDAFRTSNCTRRGRQLPLDPDRHFDQQLKKGGRGWLHSKKR